MITGAFPGSTVPFPASKTLNSFPLATTTIGANSSIDATDGKLRSRISYGLRYEYSKRFQTSVFSSSPAGDIRPEIDENPEGILSGEWPENISLPSYDDLRAFLVTQINSERMKPCAFLGEVMSTPIKTVTADQTLEEVNHHFEIVSGLPVIDENRRCIGVLSKRDKAKASNGFKSKVGEVMSSPAITLSAQKTALDAAALMLKKKIHRIPILNEKQQVHGKASLLILNAVICGTNLGIVTRTDVFQTLEATEL